MNKENEIISGYKKWLYENFKNRIIQNKNPMNDFIKKNFNIKYSSSIREQKIKTIKNWLFIDSINTIVVTFRINNLQDKEKKSIIYTSIYITIRYDSIIFSNSIICLGPSLLSKDGEFRTNISRLDRINFVIDKYKEIWDELEIYIIEKIDKLSWNFYPEYFYPAIRKKNVEKYIIKYITDERLSIKFLIISWFIQLFNIINKIQSNHINKIYLKIIKFNNKKILKEDTNFYFNLIKLFGKEKILEIVENFNSVSDSSGLFKISVGQKLIPLNMSEVQNPFNINYKPWKEYLISQKVQDLFINGICKGIPVIGDYYYLKDIRKTLFDNIVQYMKLEHSEHAKQIIRQLLDAQKATYQIPQIDYTNYKKLKFSNTIISKNIQEKNVLKDSIEDISLWLSDKFKTLHEKIDDPIEMIKENIIMTNVVLGIFYEFIGDTFYDFLLFNKKNKLYRENTFNPFNNHEVWSKYIFEIIYTILSLNIHCGIIHCDLHLNNITVNKSFTNNVKSHNVPININDLINNNIIPYMLYVLKSHDKSEEGIVYGFTSKQYYSCIIDFGRSVIRPSFLEIYKDFNIKESKNVKTYKNGKILFLKNYNLFYKEEVIRILNIIKKEFSDFYSLNKNQLELLIFNHFDDLFPILTVLDTYIFTKEIIKFFKLNKFIVINKKNILLVKKIFNICEETITIKLKKIIDDPNLLKKDEYKTFVNLEIINKCFSNYIIMTTYQNEWKNSDFYNDIINNKKTIIDINYLYNKFNYSLSEFSLFPENLKKSKFIDKHGKEKYINEKEKNVLKDRANEIEATKKKNLTLVSLIAKRHKEKHF